MSRRSAKYFFPSSQDVETPLSPVAAVGKEGETPLCPSSAEKKRPPVGGRFFIIT